MKEETKKKKPVKKNNTKPKKEATVVVEPNPEEVIPSTLLEDLEPAEQQEVISECTPTPDPVPLSVEEFLDMTIPDIPSEQPEPVIKEKEDQAYLVKCNKFLPNKLSKYEIRIDTKNGYRVLRKTSREKAYFLATKYNNNQKPIKVIE